MRFGATHPKMVFTIQFLLTLMLGLGLSLVVLAAELAFPRGEQLTNKERIRAAGFMSLYLLITQAAFLPFAYGLKLIGVSKPLFNTVGLLGGTVAAILAVVAFDLLYYWFHRAQHRFKPLWKIHSVHHSIEKLGVPTAYHHPLEPFLQAMFCRLPLFLVIPAPYAVGVSFLLSVQSYYLHSATRLHLGPLGLLIPDNRMHRIHHSKEMRHQNKNFGVNFFIWDHLFRTAYIPRNEWPDIGLVGMNGPRTLMELAGLGITLQKPSPFRQ